jgi:hypothetical protein
VLPLVKPDGIAYTLIPAGKIPAKMVLEDWDICPVIIYKFPIGTKTDSMAAAVIPEETVLVVSYRSVSFCII